MKTQQQQDREHEKRIGERLMALWEDRREALSIIDALKDQQAMPDDSLDARIAALRARP
jgi:hypothetical protein